MKAFVILFRQSRPLTDSELQQRAAETPTWARAVNAAGHKLEPRILGPESIRHGTSESAAAATPSVSVTALLFLEAESLEQAAALASGHPALKYGASIEVRPWASPTPAAAQSTPAAGKPIS